jgi:hypothetical protein
MIEKHTLSLAFYEIILTIDFACVLTSKKVQKGGAGSF